MTPWVPLPEMEYPQRSADARRGKRDGATRFKLAMVGWLMSLKDSRPVVECRGSAGEPGWDMLLDLYLGELLGRKTSVTSACIAARVPPTTALRHVSALCAAGRIERVPDENDARRCWLRLAPTVREEIDQYLRAMVEDFRDIVNARF